MADNYKVSQAADAHVCAAMQAVFDAVGRPGKYILIAEVVALGDDPDEKAPVQWEWYYRDVHAPGEEGT